MDESDALLDYLGKAGVDARTYEHPPVHTVEESKSLRGDIPGLHTKNLFLRAFFLSSDGFVPNTLLNALFKWEPSTNPVSAAMAAIVISVFIIQRACFNRRRR